MEICLVRPSRHPQAVGLADRSESVALGYLASALRCAGHRVTLLNAALRPIGNEALTARIIGLAPTLVGVSMPDNLSWEGTARLCTALRQSGFAGHTCVGGHAATFHCEDVLTGCDAVDSVALHEGEDTIVELAHSLESSADWRSVPGLVYRSGDAIGRSPARALRPDLDGLAFPARDDLPFVLDRFADSPVPVLASRGCHFNCGFCSVRAFYERDGRRTWRRRSVDNILDEIEGLVACFGASDVLFIDDLFLDGSNRSQAYARSFADGLLRRNLGVTFTLSATADSIEAALFRQLRDAGLRKVFVGAESGTPEILAYLSKWFGPKTIREAAVILRDLSLQATISWMNFTPATRIEHLEENAVFFSELGYDIIPGLLNRYQVYAGTPLFDRLRSEGRLRGTFPAWEYVDLDPAVARVYRVCKRVFRPWLDVSEALRSLERRTRLTMSSRSGSVHTTLAAITRSINADVVAAFREALAVAAATGRADDAGSDVDEDALARLAHRVVESAAGWLATIRVAQNLDALPTQGGCVVLEGANNG